MVEFRESLSRLFEVGAQLSSPAGSKCKVTYETQYALAMYQHTVCPFQLPTTPGENCQKLKVFRLRADGDCFFYAIFLSLYAQYGIDCDTRFAPEHLRAAIAQEWASWLQDKTKHCDNLVKLIVTIQVGNLNICGIENVFEENLKKELCRKLGSTDQVDIHACQPAIIRVEEAIREISQPRTYDIQAGDYFPITATEILKEYGIQLRGVRGVFGEDLKESTLLPLYITYNNDHYDAYVPEGFYNDDSEDLKNLPEKYKYALRLNIQEKIKFITTKQFKEITKLSIEERKNQENRIRGINK